MKKTITLLIVLIIIIVLTIRFVSVELKQFFGVSMKSGVSITTIPEGAVVFLDGNEVGKTPYDNKDLEVKEYKVKLEKDNSVWEGKVKLITGTITLINRELSSDIVSSAGDVLYLEKGKGINVISNPSGSDVEVDSKIYGKTPIGIDLLPGEHTILVTHPNYLKRSIKVTLPLEYSLTIATDLGLSEADLAIVSAPLVSVTPIVIVKKTPTGFLRVRDKPSLLGKEVSRVNPGDELVLLEEVGGWDRVKLKDKTEGYVSVTYVEKKKQDSAQDPK